MSKTLHELFRIDPGRDMLKENGAGIKSGIRLLLVEDDHDIAQLVELHLQDLHADIRHCDRGDEALQLALNESWDLLILDLRLPVIDGLEICRKLREQGDYTPILMLTSKSTELDRVLGLEIGADDYVTKPFSPVELVARVRVILRRMSQLTQASESADSSDYICCGNVEIDIKKHSVLARKREIDLTAREFDLLLHFMRHPDQVFRRTELLDRVWGYGHEGYEHTVNSHINRLRSKIEKNPSSPDQILTVWGVGYKFTAAQQNTI